MVKILFLVMVTLFIALGGRLFYLQIVNGKSYRLIAENNRAQKQKIEPPRGIITDRHGEVLADSEPRYFVVSGNTQEETPVGRDEALARLAGSERDQVVVKLKRRYPYRDGFAHLIGYLNEVTGDELVTEKLDLRGYGLGSLIGRAGVEGYYETTLHGRAGSELVEIDTLGRIRRRMGQILPTPGKRLVLAVDRKLQQAASTALAGRKGAVIATNPKNGEILTIVSSPSYDPGIFTDKTRNSELSDLIKDSQNQPLYNRAIAGIYAPGSTFKIITSVAGLAENKITPETTYVDTGVVTYGAFRYTNWFLTGYGRTEGEITLVKALARSTDTFFYKVGEWAGVEALVAWAEKFGLNKPYGIDLAGESTGFIATPKWKEENRGEVWYMGNTYHMAIGQGDVDLTPLGVNMMTAAVANGGKICTPRVLKLGSDNTPYKEECREVGVKAEYLTTITKGMVGACSAGGTAFPFFDFKPQVACKTGTAETGDPKATHAWLTGFAPVDNPEIVVTVLLEKGGEGSTDAAPVAKEVFKAYFEGR